ncbi:hypothetical protein EV360DRAFT_74706 [Lentinula raphanica]|nr:hypothetical protein EV360DRAFT_74706 [Lentinula raphanica]
MTIFTNENFLAPLTLAEGGRGMARQISRLVTSLSFSGMTKPKHLRGVNRKPQAVNDKVEEHLQRAKEAILESTESKFNLRKEAHEKEALLTAEEKEVDKISPSSTSGLPRAPSPAPGPSEDMSPASQSAQMIEDPLITMPSTSSIASSLTPLAVTSSPNSSSSDAQSPSPNLRRENELLQNENTFLRLQYFNAMEMIAVLRERCKQLEAVGRAARCCQDICKILLSDSFS